MLYDWFRTRKSLIAELTETREQAVTADRDHEELAAMRVHVAALEERVHLLQCANMAAAGGSSTFRYGRPAKTHASSCVFLRRLVSFLVWRSPRSGVRPPPTLSPQGVIA